MSSRTSDRLRICFILAIALTTILATPACEDRSTEKTLPLADAVTREALIPVFGPGEGDKSGVFDVNQASDELQVSYRFYATEQKDIDDDIGVLMAPAVRELYKRFPSVDRVLFLVQVLRVGLDPTWTPYCTFVLTRKIFRETEWTALLDKDFFKAVLDLKYAQ